MQSPEMQNPGLAPRASRDCFGGPSLPSVIASERQAQLLCRCFCLSRPLARDMAWLCFGEGSYD